MPKKRQLQFMHCDWLYVAVNCSRVLQCVHRCQFSVQQQNIPVSSRRAFATARHRKAFDSRGLQPKLFLQRVRRHVGLRLAGRTKSVLARLPW